MSADFSANSLQYSQVCGRITGYQYGNAVAEGIAETPKCLGCGWLWPSPFPFSHSPTVQRSLATNSSLRKGRRDERGRVSRRHVSLPPKRACTVPRM